MKIFYPYNNLIIWLTHLGLLWRMEATLQFATRNIEGLSQLIASTQFNTISGGFEFEDEKLGKGDSEFFEIVFLFMDEMKKEERDVSALQSVLVAKFTQYIELNNEDDFRVRIPDFYGMENLTGFLRKQSGQTIRNDIVVKGLEIVLANSEESPEKEECLLEKKETSDEKNNDLECIYLLICKGLRFIKLDIARIKKHKLIAKNYYLLFLKMLSPFLDELRNNKSENGELKSVERIVREYLNFFGKSESIVSEIFSIFITTNSLFEIVTTELGAYLETNERILELKKLLSIVHSKKEQNSLDKSNLESANRTSDSFNKSSTELLSTNKSEKIKCISNYIEKSSNQPKPAKGHRVIGDKWLLFLLDSIEQHPSRWSEMSTSSAFLRKYASEKLIRKSRFNIDGTKIMINACFDLGLCEKMGSEFKDIDLKGNQIETLGPMFYKTFLEMMILETSGETSLRDQLESHRKGIYRFNGKNFLEAIDYKSYWRIDEFELLHLSMEKSYVRRLIFLAQMQKCLKKTQDKNYRTEAVEDCLKLLRDSWEEPEMLDQYIELASKGNKEDMSQRVRFGTFESFSFCNLDLSVHGNNFGLFSDKNFFRLILRIWQLTILIRVEEASKDVQIFRKKEAQNSNPNLNKKSKKKKKGKKANKKISSNLVNKELEEHLICKMMKQKKETEEDLLKTFDKKFLVEDILYLISLISTHQFDLDFNFLRPRTHKDKPQIWKRRTNLMLKSRLDQPMRNVFLYCGVVLRDLFAIPDFKVSTSGHSK